MFKIKEMTTKPSKELVIGGGGALYPYFSGWAHAISKNLSVAEIDDILFTTHSVSVMVPTLLWIWRETKSNIEDIFFSFDQKVEENIKSNWIGPLFRFFSIWKKCTIPYIQDLNMDWINDHVIMNAYSVKRNQRVIYKSWENPEDYMTCSTSTCHIPLLSWFPLGYYKKDFVIDGCVSDYYHSCPKYIQLNADTFREFPKSRMFKLWKFDDHFDMFQQGVIDMTKYLHENRSLFSI